MISDVINELVSTRLRGWKVSQKGWKYTNCPMCIHRGHRQDKKQRFGLTDRKDGTLGMNCFNCRFKARVRPGCIISGNIVSLLSAIGVDDDTIAKIKFASFKESTSDVQVISDNGSDFRSMFHTWKPMSLPNDAKSFTNLLDEGCADSNFLKVLDYAKSRCVTDMSALYWSPETSNMMNKRMIIPFKYNNNIVGYGSRFASDNASMMFKRYIQKMPDSFIYGYSDQLYSYNKYCIIAEGVLDALLVKGITTLGSINSDQANAISLLDKDIIVCPDRDKAGQLLIDYALEYNWKVSFPKWNSDIKDPAKSCQVYGQLATVKSIIDGAVSCPIKIQVLRKFDKFTK